MAKSPAPEERRLMSVAYSTSGVLTGPVLLGLLIDWVAGTLPWCTVAGVFVGMGGLFVLLIRLTKPKGPRALRGLAVLVGVTVLAWTVLAGPSMLLGGAGPEVTVPAALICLAPNLLALGVTELVRTRSQTAQTGVLLASFLVRPLLAIGLGLATYYLLPHLHGRALALLVWGALFYLILLGAESIVVSRRVGSTAGR